MYKKVLITVAAGAILSVGVSYVATRDSTLANAQAIEDNEKGDIERAKLLEGVPALVIDRRRWRIGWREWRGGSRLPSGYKSHERAPLPIRTIRR